MSLHECAKLFREEVCERSNIVDSLVAEIFRKYCFSNPMFKVHRPLRNQKLNTFLEKELAITYEHFRGGFHLPLISEWIDILNYYGFILAQIFSNGISLVTAVIILLREKKIPFSINLFSKLVLPKKYAGGFVMFLSRKGVIRLESIPDKISDWTKCFCFAFCENWGVPTEPIVQSESYFGMLTLTNEEKDKDYITSNRINEVLMRGMSYIGDDISMIAGMSEEVDSVVMRLKGGETSTAAVYAPLLLPEAETTEEPSGPDPKEKRKMMNKDNEEDQNEKKKPSKQPRHTKEKPKKAIRNIDIDNEYAKVVEAQSLEDLSAYVGKWVENMFEGVARIDISTQSIFVKINNERKEANKERNLFDEVHTIDTARIAEQEKRISDLEDQLALLKEEQKSLITKNAEEIIKIKRDAEERISQAEKKAVEKIDLMRMRNADEIELKRKISDDFREDYRRRCKEDLAFEKSKVNHVINEMKEAHKKEIDQAKIDVVKKFTEDDDFVDYFRTMHQNTVDDILNTMKRFGDITSDYDHGILFSQLPKPNEDM